MNSLRIMIVLFHSTKNLGDRAILESTINRLRKTFSNPKIVVLANYPEESYFNSKKIVVEPSPWVIVGKSGNRSILFQLSKFLIGLFWTILASISFSIDGKIASFIPVQWKELFQQYLEADIVIGSGGNQFYSTGKFGWPLPLNAMSVWLAHVFKKPFYTMPQSLGPFKRQWEKHLIVSLYSKNRINYLRDKKSIQLAHEIGLKPYAYAPDLAFFPYKSDSKEALSILSEHGLKKDNHHIGMTIIAPMGLALDKEKVNEYYKILALTIEKMIENFGCDVYIFRQVSGPTELENDGLANLFVGKKVGDAYQEKLHIINQTYSPRRLMALYQQMDLFIASRLHSGIFALNKKVPTVFVGYLSKTLGVLESIGFEQWGIDISDITTEKFWSIICRAWQQRSIIQADLIKYVPIIFQQTERILPSVLNDYQSLKKN